jgi:hypothetical protein
MYALRIATALASLMSLAIYQLSALITSPASTSDLATDDASIPVQQAGNIRERVFGCRFGIVLLGLSAFTLCNLDLGIKADTMLLHPQPPISSSFLLHFVLESAIYEN